MLPMESNTVINMAKDAPLDQRSAPDSSTWPLSDQLLGNIIDAVQMGNWQRGGGKGPRPDSILAANRPIAAPAAGVDVRALLSRGAPESDPTG